RDLLRRHPFPTRRSSDLDWLLPWLCPPREAMAELMPTTSPRMSTSGPPELPGLIAASVWIASMTVSWLVLLCASPVRTGRFTARSEEHTSELSHSQISYA